MVKDTYNIIGVMSGTSLDGIDLVYAKFKRGVNWNFEILYSQTIGYPAYWFDILKGLVSNSLEELKVIDVNYTLYLAKVIQGFIAKNHIVDIDAVCSHGHTALHQPENKLTYQIGNLPVLADILQEMVVCDFRVQDVMMGGQGAPLVPVGDKLLFSEYDACLNLGGFANISMFAKGEYIAFDVCPVNIVLNVYANKLGLDFDDGGKIAASGRLLPILKERLDNLDFYNEKPPKSLGLEWVTRIVMPLLQELDDEEKDILKTFSDHVAKQIANVLKDNSKVLVTGGGAYNAYIVSKIKENKNVKIVIPDNNLVEFKEAMVFGFLGVLKLRNETNCMKSVTGSARDHSSGKIFIP